MYIRQYSRIHGARQAAPSDDLICGIANHFLMIA
jgi:hypothetical protein